MRMEETEVTPDMARRWMESAVDIRQRRITETRVTQYAHAMQRGQWRVTHQAIALDEEGVLIDGQHRLSAVIAARTPVRMMVAYDVPRDTFDTFDSGAARSTATVLHIAGITDPNVASAASKMILMYGEIEKSRRLPGPEVRRLFTSRDVLDFMGDERGDTLRSAIAPARTVTHSLGRFGARSWLTASYTMILESKPDSGLFNEFVERAASGESLSAGAPILTWRRWMISESGYGKATSQAYRGMVGIASVIKTWNAWIAGSELRVMRIRPGKDLWPAVGDAPDVAEVPVMPELELALTDA